MLAETNRSAYETTYNVTDAQLALLGDINQDGVVNNADIQAFLNYLKTGNGSTAAVPEPSSFILLGIALFGLLPLIARRRSSKVKSPSVVKTGLNVVLSNPNRNFALTALLAVTLLFGALRVNARAEPKFIARRPKLHKSSKSRPMPISSSNSMPPRRIPQSFSIATNCLCCPRHS